MVDCIHGTNTYSMGAWLGFNGDDCVATIDLGGAQEISTCNVRTLTETRSWCFDANGLKVEVSDDGQNFRKVAEEFYPLPKDEEREIRNHTVSFDKVKARYVRVTVGTVKSIPQFHSGHGKPAYLFVDEIEVN